MNPSDSSPSPQDATGPQLATTRQLSDADKLRKVICELLETERTYVKVRLLPQPRGLVRVSVAVRVATTTAALVKENLSLRRA